MKIREQHLTLIDLLCDLDDERSKKEKSVAAGFSDTYVFMLLKEPDFLAAMRERTSEHLAAGRPEVLGAIKRRAVAGSTKDAELYLKATGDIGSGLNVVTNVTQNNDQNEDFRERLEERFQERRLASARQRPIPQDED